MPAPHQSRITDLPTGKAGFSGRVMVSIREVLSSYLGWVTAYSVRYFLCDCTRYLPVSAGITP